MSLKSVLCLCASLLICLSIQAQDTKKQDHVLEPVMLQLKGYNNRDIETFAAAFSDTVKVFRQPGVLSYQGKEELKKRYGQMFANTPDLNCEVVNRIVAGNVVIDHEKVRRSKDQPRFDAIAVYRVQNNIIVEVTFISPDTTK
ncbi:nuclear transport factor 2 family protein [Pontibacter sp. SGAir0037]|uniref:nuclear transport factor 2 family protein n=1 Tax=Pontibacter sp. SGAir0037 TaxID=2571030 RepID=UPI0010CCEEE2|nr:nuclear transport factor 2 family protein [Pontibacter sp. SGAir0037]QCR21093.1 steroid delta-isomerase [Pontibacter sp. SGAir0037]